MKTLQQHNEQVQEISKKIKEHTTSIAEKKLRFYHGGSNSTRGENTAEYFWIDISALDNVIELNKEKSYVLVEPNVSMDKLVATTLRYGLLPKVVMEFPGITVGGAINGATLESSSFRHGQFNDNCVEYEIILGNGEVISVSEKENKDMFYGISGIYGSLGLVTLAKVLLVPAKKYVHTTFYPVKTWKAALEFIKEQMQESTIDFIEGIIFDKEKAVVITGKLTDGKTALITTYTKASDLWFYEQARKVSNKNGVREELIAIVDYLFRYNRGAFWVGEYVFPLLHIPNNRLMRYLLNPVFNTRKLYDGMVAFNIGQMYFVQDFYVPYNKSLDLLEYTDKNIGIYPIWLCPIKPTQTPQKLSPHNIDDTVLMDIGIWGQTEKYLADPIGANRSFESFAKKIGGKKMLYAHQYYTEDEFWKIYDKKWYDQLRKKYKADKTFPDVWQKTHVAGLYKTTKKKGVLKILKETLQGKHINT